MTFDGQITRLEQLRLDKGWTQRELALKAGVLQQTISQAENGQKCQVKTLAALGRALGVPASTLLLKVTPQIVEPIRTEEHKYPDLPDAA